MTLDDVRVLRRLLVLTTVVWLGLVTAASAADVTADRFDDPDGSGACTAAANDCSLRQAIDFATPGDTVRLLNASYSVEKGTINVTKALSIVGLNRLTSIIDGTLNNQYRIMRVSGAAVTLTDLSFTGGVDGHDEITDPTSINRNGGGALFNNNGNVTIQRARFYANYGISVGGAIASSGTLSVTDADFDGNGGSFGAGIFVRAGTATLDRVSLRNAGGTQGGGLFVRGGNVSVTNTTVANNGQSSTRGGGIVNQGTLSLKNVTLVDNVRGGLETDVGASTTVQNTILGASPYQDGQASACVSPGLSSAAGGTSAQPITTSLGNNLSEDTICNLNGPADQIAGNAHLAPATSNGGNPYSWTAALLHGSTAIDGGNDSACTPLDGRANARSGLGAHCDIGAFEATKIAAPTITSTSSHEVTDTHATLSSEFDMKGESGTLHFMYGQSPTALINPTGVAATGIGQQLVQSVELDGLQPTTTYYFAAVLDNATGAATGPTQQFTTSASSNPPQVFAINVDAVTDTTAALRFQIDPQGQATTYVIEGGRRGDAAGDDPRERRHPGVHAGADRAGAGDDVHGAGAGHQRLGLQRPGRRDDEPHHRAPGDRRRRHRDDGRRQRDEHVRRVPGQRARQLGRRHARAELRRGVHHLRRRRRRHHQLRDARQAHLRDGRPFPCDVRLRHGQLRRGLRADLRACFHTDADGDARGDRHAGPGGRRAGDADAHPGGGSGARVPPDGRRGPRERDGAGQVQGHVEVRAAEGRPVRAPRLRRSTSPRAGSRSPQCPGRAARRRPRTSTAASSPCARSGT